VKGIIDFEKGKVLEVFLYALDRQGLFIEGFVPDLMAPAGNPFLISPLGINLPNPPGITVAGRSNKDVLRELSKREIP